MFFNIQFQRIILIITLYQIFKCSKKLEKSQCFNSGKEEARWFGVIARVLLKLQKAEGEVRERDEYKRADDVEDRVY